jgi:hypothetical protein
MKRMMFAAVAVAIATQGESPFAEPFRALADGKPINVTMGHAAPLWTDFDGDGLNDLLVGQFDGGKLLFFKNVGTATAPKFGKGEFVMAGGKVLSVPYG